MERLALREGGVFGISFLRSSYITGKHVFYVAHYLDDPFVEEAPEAVCLSIAGLFDKACGAGGKAGREIYPNVSGDTGGNQEMVSGRTV